MKNIFMSLLFVIIAASSAAFAQGTTQQPAAEDITKLAQSVAGKDGSTEQKTRRLVNWVNTNFKWSYTDYQRRTAEEVIQRRAGNCAELASVLAELLKRNNLTFRWMHEVNIQPKKESRQESAAKLVAQKGNTYSAFGLMHNDHVWLEVMDEKSKAWFPADAAVGVVGIRDWTSARMAFTNRRQPQVPAVVEIVKEMLVPVAVVVFDKTTGKPTQNRTEFYIIEGFDKFYGNKLQKLPSWNEWKTVDAQLSPMVSAALAGTDNLHTHEDLIEQVAQTYEKLKAEAIAKKLATK